MISMKLTQKINEIKDKINAKKKLNNLIVIIT